MRSSRTHTSRVASLVLGLVISISTAAVLLGQVVGNSSTNDNMRGNMGSGQEIRQLTHTLSGAYENALMHGSSRTDLQADDVLLENASIEFASRALGELKGGACSSNAPNAPTDNGAGSAALCPLADPSLGLGDWAEMISYSAYRLENLARSAATGGADASQAIIKERLEAMDHLYRMVFAVARIYLDRPQSHAYSDSAQQQLTLARQHMEAEHTLCEGEPSGYESRLTELSRLDQQLNEMRETALP